MEFKSVNKILEKSFKDHWEQFALSNYQGVTLSYRDVARRIAKLHIAFEQCGLEKGDKVAISPTARWRSRSCTNSSPGTSTTW